MYLGLSVNDKNELYVKDLLNVDGKIIDFKLSQNDFFEYEIEEFNDINKIIEAVDSFGIGMIYFIPEKMFENKEIYLKLFDYSYNQVLFSTKENCIDCLSKFCEIIELLINKQKIYKIKLEYNTKIIEILSSFDNKIENKITLNYIKRELEELLNRLFN